MAAVESRELVGAAYSFALPKCAEAREPHSEREQKAEQHLENARRFEFLLRQVHLALDAGRRFTESCKAFK
jgi:hypothetical protein